jgi:hypothetical protein
MFYPDLRRIWAPKFKAWEVSHIEICGTFHNAEDEFIDKQVGVKHFSAALSIRAELIQYSVTEKYLRVC